MYFIHVSLYQCILFDFLMQHNAFFGRAPEIDISELESLFSMASISDNANKGAGARGSKINKPEKVQLVSDILKI